MFNDAPFILSALASRLHTDPNGLGSFWTSLALDGQARAYQEIVGALVQRGFTLAQIQAWDEGASFERDMALYYALNASDRADLAGASLNRFKQLAGVAVFIGGVFTEPGLVAPGQVMTGRIGRGTEFGPRGAFYEPRDCRFRDILDP